MMRHTGVPAWRDVCVIVLIGVSMGSVEDMVHSEEGRLERRLERVKR